ncbi:hypothetical protein LWI28_018900 [Acer negundo]|uniref:Uncharacterized protein n=1 Tax=Acer negundo TaxID=4023 RepID=A0AAD5NK37_ACENE|nr:hypothetical protein LWI28_018900 [Acer negundo]
MMMMMMRRRFVRGERRKRSEDGDQPTRPPNAKKRTKTVKNTVVLVLLQLSARKRQHFNNCRKTDNGIHLSQHKYVQDLLSKTGLATLIKSVHQDWSSAAIRSALVTTAWPLIKKLRNCRVIDLPTAHVEQVCFNSLPSKANINTEDYVQLLYSMYHLPGKQPPPWTQPQPTIHHNPKSQGQGTSDSKGDKCETCTLTQCTKL